MFKVKKRPLKKEKLPVLYNILENYTDHDPPGNVMVCAMTEAEDLGSHAKVLSESYDIPLETVSRLLLEGGLYEYPQSGSLVTKGLFVCKVDPSGAAPKQTWVLDVEQYAETEQLRTSWGLSMEEAASRVFFRTLPQELKERLQQKNLGLDYAKLELAVARGGDVKYIDFRKDWSPHFKRKCVMPDGKLVETSGLEDFARFHSVSQQEARHLLDHGGTCELKTGGVLACQIVNGQPSVARFNARQYSKAKALVKTKGGHIMDALSEVAMNDPILMRALRRADTTS
ncbi:MAG: hypothetical protein MRJ96_16845 [Nitrospirales bacterium]|nr:hypothetical protein [Nitrospira sp.]MDR4503113.1 hypothetical protein [Nitrospirales bacterium]